MTDNSTPEMSDLKNSVPFDFFLDADSREFEEEIDEIYREYLKYRGEDTTESKPNEKTKVKLRKTLKTVLLNLNRSFQNDPDRWISVSLNKNFYRQKGVVGKHKLITYDPMVSIIKFLEACDLVERKKGYYVRNEYGGRGKVTRIRLRR